MGYWIGYIFWALIIVAAVSVVYGLSKKSWQALVICGITLLLPMLYFAGAENWVRLLGLVPLLPFVLAFYIRNRAR
ncbi:hypothetical protein [Ammoniphilus sp. CFH 90114]|uniref:hypothetical protein n=1 Tax=Ammoniphilus sp. CFH 90114 TaxID=2493665 RepID=UPI00100E3CE8|nr:hypothetical protein [Ammoniphilus sp. CFH 90114]RXT07145.1 hypothetical protein EIZ39_13435 [Ammoniphilus sp. CFH 90114]